METEIIIPNECSLDKVGPDYKPIVNAAIESYRRDLDKLLVSIRLLGSAARGESVFGVSDIDFVGLVSMNPDIHQRDMIEADSKRLTRSYQSVSMVDLEIEIKGRVQPQREFIFRTDSVCIWVSRLTVIRQVFARFSGLHTPLTLSVDPV
jgi:predicted nucleotidyltransferase